MAHQLIQRDAVLVMAHQLGMRVSQRRKATGEGIDEGLGRRAAAHRLGGQSLHRRESVLHAVLQLPHQQPLGLTLGGVAHDGNRHCMALDLAAAERRLDGELSTVLALPRHAAALDHRLPLRR
jgi:hypothetical protein